MSKKLYEINRLSMCTQDSFQSKKSKMLPPSSVDQTLQEGINNSNINRQNFDGQTKIGNQLKNLQSHSFKENRLSLATQNSIASTKDTLSRTISHFMNDSRFD